MFEVTAVKVGHNKNLLHGLLQSGDRKWLRDRVTYHESIQGVVDETGLDARSLSMSSVDIVVSKKMLSCFRSVCTTPRRLGA